MVVHLKRESQGQAEKEPCSKPTAGPLKGPWQTPFGRQGRPLPLSYVLYTAQQVRKWGRGGHVPQTHGTPSTWEEQLKGTSPQGPFGNFLAGQQIRESVVTAKHGPGNEGAEYTYTAFP